MRRNVAWVAILLVLAALAVPAAAAPAPGTGGIHGVITDWTTGDPFDLTGAELITVDVFNTATMARERLFIQNLDTGVYAFDSLTPGYYKMRFRYLDTGNTLTRYRWYDDKANFGLAAEIHVISGASLEINFTLKPMKGAEVSGTVTERGTGTPLGGDCFYMELFEESGISLGILYEVALDGSWDTAGRVPAGRLTALAGYSAYPLGCEGGPSHLDTWRGGASGYPLHTTDLSADPGPFATAHVFVVNTGVPLPGIDIAMLPAPTCRGKVPTIFGTTLADTITGTAARDIISGLAGNDTISGLAGNDLLCGDAGTDVLTGGGGAKDVADGGTGIDICTAETIFRCP